MTDLESLVAAALPEFGVEARSVELMSHSENLVFAVEALSGQRYAARLHRPGYNSVVEMESEVAWVRALADGGVRVPLAVPRLSPGDFDGLSHYVEIDVGTVNGTGAADRRQLGLIEWVDGSPLGSVTSAEGGEGSAAGGEESAGGGEESAGGGIVRQYRDIGSVIARVRAASEDWTPPRWFRRRRWDADAFVADAPLWGRFWEAGQLSTEQRQLFVAARDRLGSELAALSTGPESFGLIHADLHLANVMSDGRELTVIDFDDAGYGWFVHEIAVSLHPMLDDPRYDDALAAIVEGYRDVVPLGDADVALIDLFMTVRCLMIVGWLDARPEVPIYEFFPELAAQSEAQARRYLGR